MSASAADHRTDLHNTVDFKVVGRWMDELGLPGGPCQRITPVGGGTQNILVRFERGGVTYVLRRPPRHPRPGSNTALRREIAVLSALEASDVPHPRMVAACLDEAVMDGVVFYLMDEVDGFNPTTHLPRQHASDPAIRHEMGLAAVDALAQLGAVDHTAVGLEGLGHPEGFLERQVDRWLRELDSYGSVEGYPGPDLPGVERIAGWLERNRPAPSTPGIVHGDYHLANLMFRYDSADVAAIVDWEMATVGDPLLDLGWLLATWPDADGRCPGARGPLLAAGDLPPAGDLVCRYGERSTRDLSAVDWYVVLACFKLGIVLEGTFARACAGKAAAATGKWLHSVAVDLFARAAPLTAGGLT